LKRKLMSFNLTRKRLRIKPLLNWRRRRRRKLLRVKRRKI
jgi:hypothetical protein